MDESRGVGWAHLAPDDGVAIHGSREPLQQALNLFASVSSATRIEFLEALMSLCDTRELSHVEALIGLRLKVDFLQRFPMEVGLHILGYLRDPKALTSAARVSKTWRKLANDEYVWGNLCSEHGYALPSKLHWMLNSLLPPNNDQVQEPMQEDEPRVLRHSPSSSFKGALKNGQYRIKHSTGKNISLRQYYRLAYLTERNWLSSGRLLSIHVTDELADADPDPNHRLAITCCAIDANYIVVGMTKQTVYVFSARTGKLLHALDEHESGVWCLMLAAGTHPTSSARTDIYQAEGLRRTYLDRTPSAQLSFSDDPKHNGLALQEVMENAQLRDNAQDAVLGHTPGWGSPDTILISAGSDRNLRTWNLRTGECEHVLKGHTSTIRCVQVLKGRPLAVSGSRDGTLRVWDLEHGRLVHVLAGHQHSVRCLDTAGNRVASGSYDFTCRIWDVDTGQCLHILKGHHLQIYAIAFDGRYVVAGSSDSTVRVWNAETGACLAVFQGYTHVVAQLQLYNDVLASGSGDGRVIVFSLKTFECLYRLCAHDSSVSTLQMNDKFLVTGGADGLVKLWDAQSGRYIRQLCDPCETVWAIKFWEDKCVILCTFSRLTPGKRNGRCSIEITSFLPTAA